MHGHMYSDSLGAAAGSAPERSSLTGGVPSVSNAGVVGGVIHLAAVLRVAHIRQVWRWVSSSREKPSCTNSAIVSDMYGRSQPRKSYACQKWPSFSTYTSLAVAAAMGVLLTKRVEEAAEEGQGGEALRRSSSYGL